MIADHGLRQYGVQEVDIVTLVSSITKYAVTVKDPLRIRFELEKAVHIMRHGRPGPVWIDIPLDVQSKDINPDELVGYRPHQYSVPMAGENDINECIRMLKAAKRPVLVVGYGVRLAGAEARLNDLIDTLKIPVISSWTASDMVHSPYHIGHMGIFGDRASNFTVQNADLVLVIGSRLSIPMIGYDGKHFARNAKVIMVDMDRAEMVKPSMHVDLQILSDAKWFMNDLLASINSFDSPTPWLGKCLAWREQYPVCLPDYEKQKDGINAFYFVNELSRHLPDDAIVVVDTGASFTCTFAAAKMKKGQRWINASGMAPMGYSLPAAIGAAFATGKKVICIVGDGSLQFNLAELQTIVHHQLPITIFVLNNNGYLTIQHMQDNHFKRRVGSDPASGVSCPSTALIARAYGIEEYRMIDKTYLDKWLWPVLEKPGPYICEIMMPEGQPLIPRVMSQKLADGTIKGGPIEDLYPYLPRDEFEAAMAVSKESAATCATFDSEASSTRSGEASEARVGADQIKEFEYR